MLTLIVSVVVWVVVLLPAMGFAQEAAPIEDGTTMIAGWLQAVIALACTFGTYLLEVLRRYLTKVTDLAAQSTKLAFLNQVDDIIMNKISELWQTEVKAMKRASADGKLTPTEKAALKQKAVDWTKSLLDARLLTGLFGVNVDGALGSIVDGNVVRAKNIARLPELEVPLVP